MPARLPPPVVVYVVVDITVEPPTLVDVKLSRQEARKALERREDADRLRVRRAKMIVYGSDP